MFLVLLLFLFRLFLFPFLLCLFLLVFFSLFYYLWSLISKRLCFIFWCGLKQANRNQRNRNKTAQSSFVLDFIVCVLFVLVGFCFLFPICFYFLDSLFWFLPCYFVCLCSLIVSHSFSFLFVVL